MLSCFTSRIVGRVKSCAAPAVPAFLATLFAVFVGFSGSAHSSPVTADSIQQRKPEEASAELLLQQAFSAQTESRFQESADLYQKYLSTEAAQGRSGTDFIRLQYARVLMEIDRQEEAASQIEQAIQSPVTEADLVEGILLLSDLGKNVRSLDLTLQSLTTYPANIELNYHAAEMLRTIGQEERSINYYTRVLHVAPPGDYRSGYYRSNSLWKLAIHYVSKQNVEAASLYAMRFLEYHPESLGARYLLGAGVYFENGRYNESLPHLMRLDRLPPEDLKEAGIDTERLDFLLGQILMMRFDPRAAAYFSRCKDSNPLAEQYWRVLTKQSVKSYVPLLEFLKKHPRHLPARVALLYALEQQQKYESYADELIRVSTLAAVLNEPDTGWKIIQRARKLSRERPDLKISPFSIHRLSWLHLAESEHPHRALIEARKAIEAGDRESVWGPGFERADAVDQFARLLSSEEIARYDDARQLLSEQVRKQPERHQSYMVLSLIEWRQHNWDRALEYMARSRELAPDRLDYLFLESVLLSEKGELDRAEQGYRKVLEANGDFVPAQNSLGYLLAKRGSNLQEARQLIEKAVQKEPGNAAYRDSLGWVYYQSGDYNLARFHLEMAATLMKNEKNPSPEVYEHLGDVYHKLDMPLRALEAYREALRLNDGPGKRPPGWLEEIKRKMDGIRGASG